MNAQAVHPPDAELRDCVRLFERLEQEIGTAVHAISSNALAELELSLWRQEMLCARLKRSIAGLSSAAMRGPLGLILHKALTDLRSESDRYDKVVQRSARSAALLQDLCRLYQGADFGRHAKNPSLSYEV